MEPEPTVLDSLRKAVEAMPDDVPLRLHLAELLLAEGDTADQFGIGRPDNVHHLLAMRFDKRTVDIVRCQGMDRISFVKSLHLSLLVKDV